MLGFPNVLSYKHIFTRFSILSAASGYLQYNTDLVFGDIIMNYCNDCHLMKSVSKIFTQDCPFKLVKILIVETSPHLSELPKS